MTARILLFTGKGGVGKTSVAAATALQCADGGRRTLVLSTDPAHSLADAFDRPLCGDATSVVPHLWAEQLDATERLEEAWGDVQGYMLEVFRWAGLDAIEAEELSVIPGLDEIFALADIKAHAETGEWDVIVVDCGPTAETIRLLSLPDVLGWYMERVFPVGRRLTGLVRPILTRVSSVPVADEGVFTATAALHERLRGVRDLLTDGARCTVRLVVNPERMVIAEARRTATYLGLFGYCVDAVVANRLLPDAVCDPWFDAWKESHAEHLAAIEEGFAPLPVMRAELADGELVGVQRLRCFGASLYGEVDPAALLHQGPPLSVERRNGGKVLRMPLPFADRDDLELGRRDDELLVRVGPHRRAVMLPDSLRRLAVGGARLEGDWLEVCFEEGTS
ncbi:MAG: ArsA family ATPase [Actinobacteria bacterium]|nr:MAG: ArsA family ATPase [Actinomycetota bacterium]